MLHQLATHPLPHRGGGHEQHLEIAIRHPAETDDLAILPLSAREAHGIEIVLQDQGPQRRYVLFLQEVVAGTHRGLPESDKGLVTTSFYRFNLHMYL
ncbi:hypothetical protein D3C79_761410 [compost metagenome]